MKVLVIRFSSIGDIVLTSPVVRCLKQQLPDAEIHFLTKRAMQPTIAANPYLSKIHLLDDQLDTLITQLRAEGFDYLIDLHHNLRTLRIKRALKGVKAFSFNKLNWEKWLLTRFKINRMPPVHIVDRYMATVAPLGVRNDGRGLDYFIPAAEAIRDNNLPTAHRFGYIGLVIGASFATKRLPEEMLQDLCSRIRYPIILLGGPEDQAAGDRIAASDATGKIYNACGKFTLNESAGLVKRARYIISHDTGLMHIAAAFQKQILSVWGNTVPAFGMTPYYGEAAVNGRPPVSRLFEVQGLSCRPCSKLGHARCPKGHFKCMRQQDMAALAGQVL